jgi:hypothetical protein
MEIETNLKNLHRVGRRKDDDNDCEFELVEGYKVIAFAGVMEVMMNDCRLLNLAITSKKILEEISSAESAE